jgi:predicted nucleotidyltransferase
MAEPRTADAAQPLALSAAQRALVRSIVEALLPGARVSVFGSRATARARPFSDLDLLLHEPADLSLAQRAALRDAFEASELPFRVDLVVASELEPGYRERVLGEARPL